MVCILYYIYTRYIYIYIYIYICMYKIEKKNNIFVSVIDSHRVPISKMKCVLITQICFQFFVMAVAKLSDFTVEKEFKAIRNVL